MWRDKFGVTLDSDGNCLLCKTNPASVKGQLSSHTGLSRRGLLGDPGVERADFGVSLLCQLGKTSYLLWAGLLIYKAKMS